MIRQMVQAADDLSLVRDYARTGSEAAFAALVARHAGMVYGACLRQLRRADLAEDATQAVFLLLHRKAAAISDGTVLAGWLYNAATHTSKNAIRMENRRRIHERQAAEMAERQMRQNQENRASWSQIVPVLDDAIAGLNARDREAVVLRFLERQSFAQVARSMGVTEDAAQMRVSRALNKLRALLGRRGLVISAAALGGAVRASAAYPAPESVMRSLNLNAIRAADIESGDDLPAQLADQTSDSLMWEAIRGNFVTGLVAAALLLSASVGIHQSVIRSAEVLRASMSVPAEEGAPPRLVDRLAPWIGKH